MFDVVGVFKYAVEMGDSDSSGLVADFIRVEDYIFLAVDSMKNSYPIQTAFFFGR